MGKSIHIVGNMVHDQCIACMPLSQQAFHKQIWNAHRIGENLYVYNRLKGMFTCTGFTFQSHDEIKICVVLGHAAFSSNDSTLYY